MRQMKARQMGKVQPMERRGRRRSQPFPTDETERDGNTTDEVMEPLEEGELRDQGDGVRVIHRGRRQDDDGDHDCPDEPPPGWCDV